MRLSEAERMNLEQNEMGATELLLGGRGLVGRCRAWQHREVIIMGIGYLCVSWQALLEEVVLLVGNGYVHYHVTVLPEGKRHIWHEVDEKLIKKYNADIGKDAAYRMHKNHSLAKFRYVRWGNIGIILRSSGNVMDADGTIYSDGIKRLECVIDSGRFTLNKKKKYSVQYDDVFFDIRQEPMQIRVSDKVFLEVRHLDTSNEAKKKAAKAGITLKNEQVTVLMTREFYKQTKEELSDLLVKTKSKELVKEVFERLNGIPAWRGLVIQKRRLVRYLVAEMRRHGVKSGKFPVNQTYFHLEDKRYAVKDSRFHEP